MMKYEHANAEGTGSRLCVDIERERDCAKIVLRIEPQAEGGGTEGQPSFSAEASAQIMLNAVGVAHVLNVLDGKTPSILDGKGVRTKSDTSFSSIHVDKAARHPFPGFLVHIQERWANGDKVDGRIALTLTEGAALSHALRSSMATVAFGDKA